MQTTKEDYHQTKNCSIPFLNSESSEETIDWKGEKFKWEESRDYNEFQDNNVVFDHNFNSFSENLNCLQHYSKDIKNDLNGIQSTKEGITNSNGLNKSDEMKQKKREEKRKAITRIPFQKKENSLIDRRDMVNKTILRTIRKYFRCSFKRDFPQPRFSSKVRRVNYFMSSLEQYVKAQCSEQLKHLEKESTKYFKKLGKYTEIIGRLICDNFFSRSLNQEEEKDSYHKILDFTSKYNDCCLNYSHHKFEVIIVESNFKKVFNIFMNNKEDDFLSSINAIENNSLSYKKALNQMNIVVNRRRNLECTQVDNSIS